MAPDHPSQATGENRHHPINLDEKDSDKMALVKYSSQPDIARPDPPKKGTPEEQLPGSPTTLNNAHTFRKHDDPPKEALPTKSDLAAGHQDVKSHSQRLFDNMMKQCPDWFANFVSKVGPQITDIHTTVQLIQKEKQAHQNKIQQMQTHNKGMYNQLQQSRENEAFWKKCSEQNLAKNWRLQTQINDLEDQLEKSKASKKSLETSLAQSKQTTAKDQELKETHKTVKYLREELQQSRRDANISKVAVEEMQSRIQSMGAELATLKAEASHHLRQHAVAKLSSSKKVPDATITEEWKKLHYNIRNLAHHLAEIPLAQWVSMGDMGRFRSVCAHYRMKWEHKDLRIFLIQGYLWRVVQCILTSERNVRGTDIKRTWKALQTIVNDVTKNDPEKIEKWHQWFVHGWGMLEQLPGHHANNPDCIAAEMSHISPLIPKSQAAARDDNRIHDELHNIVTSAKRLESIFGRSKAVFRTEWISKQRSSEASIYDETLMEVLNGSDDIKAPPKVMMVLSPVLFKTGNADGQCYDSCMVLEKAKVVCQRKRSASSVQP